MSKQDDLSADHMSWLVKSRSENQVMSLKLFQILKDNERRLKSNFEMADIAQALVGACFSLWRAVFLTDVLDDKQSFRDSLDAQVKALLVVPVAPPSSASPPTAQGTSQSAICGTLADRAAAAMISGDVYSRTATQGIRALMADMGCLKSQNSN